MADCAPAGLATIRQHSNSRGRVEKAATEREARSAVRVGWLGPNLRREVSTRANTASSRAASRLRDVRSHGVTELPASHPVVPFICEKRWLSPFLVLLLGGRRLLVVQRDLRHAAGVRRVGRA